MGILTMAGLQKAKHPEVKVEGVQKPMLVSDLPPVRGRHPEPVRDNTDPQKRIITISDLPRRDIRKAAVIGVRGNGKRMTRVSPYTEEPFVDGPKIFANYVPNGVWRGRRCFIIGGGPSLKRVDLSKLAGELVIGINRAYEILYPSILFGVDSQVFGWVELGQLGTESQRRFSGYGGYKAWMALHEIFPDDFYLISVDTTATPCIGTTRKLAFKNNSGYGAINLAAAMGAKEIYLLGFDMAGDRQGKQKWWHDGYPMDYGGEIYKRYIEALNEFAPVLKEAGVKVVNLNPKSKLKCFPFADLDDVLAEKPKRPMVVSYFTRRTGYAKEAERLERELYLFGLEHDIQGIEGFGSWQANTHYKAKFILEMMDKHEGRDILWLDADSSVCQYPEFFDNADFDLGVHEIDWAKYTNGKRKDHQLANAVIYLRNNGVVRGFVRAWIRENETHPNDVEMVTMARVLAGWKNKLKFVNIPASYCQIFDTMTEEGEPVIEQRQASRRYRNQVGNMDAVALSEKKKYDDCWTTNYKRSKCAAPLVQHVLKTMKKGDRVLDIGCGDCTTLLGLREAGVDCMGVDVSLAGAPEGTRGIFEAPVWDMPFDDGQFDYTVSTDVLEHVPTEMIPKAIAEILRVTKRKSFHVVALFDGIRNGVVLHMTVKPLDWWIEQFEAAKRDGIDATVISRNLFIRE